MVDQEPQIRVTLSLPYAVVLTEWLGKQDSASALAHRCLPLNDLTEKLALDHLWDQLRNAPGIRRGQWRPKLVAARGEVEEARRLRLRALVTGLLDRSLDIGTRDDCATDLGDFDDGEAFEALIQVATDAQEEEMILASAGESIGLILQRRPRAGFEPDLLAPTARYEYEAAVREDGIPS